MIPTSIRAFGVCALFVTVSGCSGRLIVADRSRGGASGTTVDDAGAAPDGEGGSGGGGGGARGGTTGTGDGSAGFSTGGVSPGAGGAVPGAGGAVLGAGGAVPGAGGAPMMHVPWMGNPPKCPTSAPESRTACQAPEGTNCGFYSTDPTSGNDAYQECACLDDGTRLLWDCSGATLGGTVCPHDAEPANGSSCFGFKGALCAYPPRTGCYCDPNATVPLWFCPGPIPALPGPTAPLDTTKPVRDMSDADRQAFCTWFATGYEGPGFPLPPDVPPSADGTAGNMSCSFGNGVACQAAYPAGLPVSSCKANLAISTCAAPLAELIDCAVTVFNSCLPSPHGCGRYLASPGCSGTILTKNLMDHGIVADGGSLDPLKPPGCAIKVK